jgi:hypothetical protein
MDVQRLERRIDDLERELSRLKFRQSLTGSQDSYFLLAVSGVLFLALIAFELMGH